MAHEDQGQSSRPYPYKRLDFDNHEIRVLNLTGGQPDGPNIEFRLEHISLIDPPPYLALSYCWGDPNNTKMIRLDGFDVDVTVNLNSALEAVYYLPGSSTDGRTIRLWVDALCINQKDNEERSQQVRNMRQIYSKAKEVVCWIGKDITGYSTRAVRFLMRGISIYGKSTFMGAWERYQANDKKDWQTVTDEFTTDEQRWIKDGWKILDKFFSQPYWKRVWVIQEVAVASKVTIVYGAFKIPWDGVASMLSMMGEKEDRIHLQERGFLNAIHLLEFRQLFLEKREPISLVEAILRSFHTLATDPRDKIFALLGLCHDGPTFVPVPNYKQPLETILIDMTRVMMAVDRSLDLICLKGTAFSGSKTPNLPTWVPDWVNLLPNNMTIQESTFSQWRTRHDFNPILEGSSSRVLKVQGRYIGKIADLTTAINQHGNFRTSSKVRPPWISSTSTLCSSDANLGNATHQQIRVRTCIWKSLLMSLLPPNFSLEAAGSCFSTLWTPEGRGSVHNIALIEWIDQNAWFKVEEWTLREWSQAHPEKVSQPYWKQVANEVIFSGRSTSDKIHEQEDLDQFIDGLDRVLSSGMRLATILAGQPVPLVAMVHPEAQENDGIYELRGCSIPVVLREAEAVNGNEQYQVVGGAYLDNDFVNYYSISTIPLEDLTLC